MMSSFRTNSIVQLQGSVYFSVYQYFSIISMIFTSFNTPNTFMNARTKKLTFQSSQWHRMCVCMPLMYFQPPILFWIRNEIKWTLEWVGYEASRMPSLSNQKECILYKVFHLKLNINLLKRIHQTWG